MPDLVPVFDELRGRLAGYAAGLRESTNLSARGKAAYAERGLVLPE
jgi:hypothetical protein